MESLRRRLDGLHSRAHTDLDASLSHASKRFKVIDFPAPPFPLRVSEVARVR
jgi:hypothetical protein